MKINLDFDRKVLNIEDNANMGFLFERIEKILPEWKEWTLETKTVIQYKYEPIIVKDYTRPWWLVNDYIRYNVYDVPFTWEAHTQGGGYIRETVSDKGLKVENRQPIYDHEGNLSGSITLELQ